MTGVRRRSKITIAKLRKAEVFIPQGNNARPACMRIGVIDQILNEMLHRKILCMPEETKVRVEG